MKYARKGRCASPSRVGSNVTSTILLPLLHLPLVSRLHALEKISFTCISVLTASFHITDESPLRRRETFHSSVDKHNSFRWPVHDGEFNEKPLSNPPDSVQRPTTNKYIKNYDFNYPQTNSIYTVTSVSGHLTSHDFSDVYRQWNSCDPFTLFDAPIETTISADSKTIEKNLQSEARKADMLMIWTDCDREGEHIGSEVANVCRRAKRNIIVKRARFSAIIAQ